MTLEESKERLIAVAKELSDLLSETDDQRIKHIKHIESIEKFDEVIKHYANLIEDYEELSGYFYDNNLNSEVDKMGKNGS